MDYMNLEADQFEAHFNPRTCTPNIEERLADQITRSLLVRDNYPHTSDISYGPSPNQTLDIFHCATENAPVLVFIHGGYWRALHKDGYSFVAPPFVDTGACVIVMHYDLAPEVSLDTIVNQTMQCLRWTHKNIARHGGNPNNIHIAGNSAGAHLAALVLAHNFEQEGLPADLIKSASLVTGVMDLAPVTKISVNEDLHINHTVVEDLSPIYHPPLRQIPILVTVGGNEPQGWIALSENYVSACKNAGIVCTYMELPGLDHLSISDAIGDGKSTLAKEMIALISL